VTKLKTLYIIQSLRESQTDGKTH